MIKESLFAAEEREAKLDRHGDVLQAMEQHVDCKALAAEADRAALRPNRARGGRPPFPTELMVRAFTLQTLYGLSDEQMEFQVLDRLSFQSFLGLRRSSQLPDRTTFWTFRERLTAAKAGDALFEAANRQLARHGYIARGGQIVDASMFPVPRQHVTREEGELIKERAAPADWKPAERRQRDVDATWTKEHGKATFGYKLSISADRRYKLIRRFKVSTASANDTLHLEDELDPANTGRDLYTDKGYVDSEREARLKGQGWRVHIQRKAAKGQPLFACQKRRNTRIARVRSRVEHVFAALEQMGGKLLRCIGLDRASFLLTGQAAAYNLRRLSSLKACGVAAFCHPRTVRSCRKARYRAGKSPPGRGKTGKTGVFQPMMRSNPYCLTTYPVFRGAPMNALVNDQLGCLRLLLGDPRTVQSFVNWSGRPARFARYTSRILYPGVRDKDKVPSGARAQDAPYHLRHAQEPYPLSGSRYR